MQKLQIIQLDGFWLVMMAAITWGTIGVATKTIYSIDTTTPLFINLTRMSIASPVLFVAGWRVVGHEMFHVRQRDFGIMVLAGLLLAISQAAYFAAIRASGVTIATLLTICVAPVVVACLSVLLRLEVLSNRIVSALVCALIGSGLLVGLRAPEGTAAQWFLGAMLSLLAAVTYASMIVCGRFLATDYHPLQVTAITFSVGTIVLMVINVANGVVVVHTQLGWALVLYLGLVPTAFAYFVFQTGLRSVSATTASIVSMLDPLVAALLAWWRFGETLAMTGIVGAGLLILSIVVLSVKRE